MKKLILCVAAILLLLTPSILFDPFGALPSKASPPAITMVDRGEWTIIPMSSKEVAQAFDAYISPRMELPKFGVIISTDKLAAKHEFLMIVNTWYTNLSASFNVTYYFSFKDGKLIHVERQELWGKDDGGVKGWL